MALLQLSVDQDGAGLTVTQQAVRVRKIRPEGDGPGLSLLNWPSIAPILPGCGNLLLVRQHEFDFRPPPHAASGWPCIRGIVSRVR